MKIHTLVPMTMVATQALAATAATPWSVAQPKPSASVANTSVDRAQIKRPPPVVKQSIPAPHSVTAQFDPDASGVQWQWTSHDCFPAGAGQPVTPCPFVKDIEGFKVYSKDGALMRSISDPAAKQVSFKSGSATCFVVTAYKGALESPKSEAACF